MPEGKAFQPDRVVEMLWGRFSYSDAGTGKPVVLIHGSGRWRDDWFRVLPFLQGRRLIRPDLCGHGGSAVPDERFGLMDLVYDILSLADELWLGKFDVVGHSLGGMIALGLLRVAPERVDKIALVEGWTALRYERALGDDAMAGLDPASRRAIVDFYRETIVRWPPLLRDQFWATVEAFDATELLRTTRHAVLEIYGDRGQPRPQPEALGVSRRSNIEFVWVPKGTHFLPLTHPRATGSGLRRFLIGESDLPSEPPLPPPTLFDLGVRR